MKKLLLLFFAIFMLLSYTNAQLTEDFETDPPAGWTFYVEDVNDPGFQQTSWRAHGGTYSFYHYDDNLAAATSAWMVSPVYTCQATTVLSFWYNQNWTPLSYNYSGVWISTTSNDPITNPTAFTELMELNASSPGGFSEDVWTEFRTSLALYSGSNIYIAFKYTGDYAHNLFIDDFSLFEPLPYDFSAISLDNDGVGFVGSDYSYLVEISNTGLNNDIYDLSLSGNAWTSVIRDKNDANTITTLSVDSGAVDTFMVKVSIPAAAALGDMDSVTYIIASQGNTSMTHDSKLYTTAFAPIQPPYTETLEDNSPYRDIAWMQDMPQDLFFNLDYSFAHNGDVSVYCNSGTMVTDGDTARVYALFDLSSVTETELRFWMYHTTLYPSYNDSLQAQVSLDGVNWTDVGEMYYRYDVNGDFWSEHIVDLSAYDGQSLIYVGITAYSALGEDMYFDDIYVGPKPPADLIFTEIMYNPPEQYTDSLEFVEIYNKSDIYSVQLENYTFDYHTSGAIHTFGDIVLGPQEYLCIAKDSAVFHDFYGIIAEEMNGPGNFSGFSNSGNRAVMIKDPSGVMIDSVNYDDGGAWPTEPDGFGPSLVICDYDADRNDGANWTYSTVFVDTIGIDTLVWASPGAKDNACFIYDIAFSQPPATHGNDFYFCELPSNWNIDFEIENLGNMAIPAGDTIFASYQFDANPVVLDTFVLSIPLDSGAFTNFTFAQSVDLSLDGDYDYILTINYENDINLLNDTSSGTLHNFVVDANLPGYNDTLYVSSYPSTIDAGAATSGGWPYSAWDWSTTETTQAIDVSADGWYYVTVTTAEDSMGNNCTAVDSVYVILGTGVQEYQVGMSVYPNPNQGSFTVVFEGNTASSVLSIMDITGRIIREEELNGDAVMQVDMTAEPKGIYFIRISNEQSIKMERIIIQ